MEPNIRPIRAAWFRSDMRALPAPESADALEPLRQQVAALRREGAARLNPARLLQLATDAGFQVLKAGGNAIDAAIAVHRLVHLAN